MGSLCIIPFNSHNSLRGSALLSCPCYVTQEETAYLAIEVKTTRLLKLNSNSSLLSAVIVITRWTFSPCTSGAAPQRSPKVFPHLSSYLAFTRALGHEADASRCMWLWAAGVEDGVQDLSEALPVWAQGSRETYKGL